MKLFTTIIPCYNAELTIAQTIKSVKDQSYKNNDLIVVDDGSTDKTYSIIKDLQKSYSFKIIRQKNKGQGAARNAGIYQSKSKYLCFLDADDIWAANRLNELSKYIYKYKADIYCNDEIIWSGLNKFSYLRNSFPAKASDLLLKGNYLSPSAVCLKSELFEKIGFFNEEREMIGVEDFDLWIRVFSEKITYKHIKKPLGIYRIYNENISKSDFYFNKVLYVNCKYFKIFTGQNIITKKEAASAKFILIFIELIKSIKSQRYSNVFTYLKLIDIRFLLSALTIKLLFYRIFRVLENLFYTWKNKSFIKEFSLKRIS